MQNLTHLLQIVKKKGNQVISWLNSLADGDYLQDSNNNLQD